MTDGKLAALHSSSLEAIGKARVLCRDLCRDIHTLLEEMQSKLNEMYSPAPALPPPPKPASPDPTTSTPATPAVPLAPSHTAVVRLQAAARGLLARRRVQSLHRETRLAVVSRAISWPLSEEQAAVRLLAVRRGFLVWRVVRKMRMLLSLLRQCAFNYSGSPTHPVAPIEVEVQVWGLPAR